MELIALLLLLTILIVLAQKNVSDEGISFSQEEIERGMEKTSQQLKNQEKKDQKGWIMRS